MTVGKSKSEASLHTFVLSVSEWIKKTGTLERYIENAEKYLDGKERQGLTGDIVKYGSKNGRASVLAKLRRKQAEIAKRYWKPAQQMEVAEDMERRRK